MNVHLDPVDQSLLDLWQNDFPLVSRPFEVIADQLSLSEDDVLGRLKRLTDAGAISRVGATCRPNTAGSSTLAAIAVPEERIEEVAAVIGAEPGVNHSYLREHHWNIWFVATGSDQSTVDEILNRVRRASGLQVLSLPLVRPFNINLGFALDGSGRVPPSPDKADASVLIDGDREIMQALSVGLELVPRPFAAMGAALGRSEDEILARTQALAAASLLSRIGVIVRHRALGWSSNAMVVWDLPEEKVANIGPALTAVAGITLCYQRRPVPVIWPYTLYCMIHARSRPEAMAVLEKACDEVGLRQVPHQVLFSIRCFKQTGARVLPEKGAAA